MKLKPGDKIRFRKGKTYDVDHPGWNRVAGTDLLGREAVVVDRPEEREGTIDGVTRERVHVAPLGGDIEQMILDVPTENIRRQGVKGFMDEVQHGARAVGNVFRVSRCLDTCKCASCRRKKKPA